MNLIGDTFDSLGVACRVYLIPYHTLSCWWHRPNVVAINRMNISYFVVNITNSATQHHFTGLITSGTQELYTHLAWYLPASFFLASPNCRESTILCTLPTNFNFNKKWSLLFTYEILKKSPSKFMKNRNCRPTEIWIFYSVQHTCGAETNRQLCILLSFSLLFVKLRG